MGLVSAKEVAKAISLNKYGVFGTFIGWLTLKVTQISRINSFYDSVAHLPPLEFVNATLEHYQIDYDISEEDLKRLPKTGAFVTISNHPLGAIDGVILIKLMLEHRPDFKIMANFLLQRMAPIEPHILPVNPFENHKDAKSSIAAFKNTLKHLNLSLIHI